MFRIVDNRSLDLTVTVPTPLLTLVHVGQPIEFTTDAEPGRRFQGRITYINPEVDETSRSVRVSASVPNLDGRLKGGLFIRGEIAVAARRHVLHLPRQSLIEWNVAGHQAAVFVVCDGRAEKRIVQIGAVNGAAVEIVDGLVAGEPVVTRGVFALRPDDAVVVSADSGA